MNKTETKILEEKIKEERVAKEKKEKDKGVIFDRNADPSKKGLAIRVKESEIEGRLKKGQATKEDLSWLDKALKVGEMKGAFVTEEGGPLDRYGGLRSYADFEGLRDEAVYLKEKIEDQLEGVKEVIDGDHKNLFMIDLKLEKLEKNCPDKESYESMQSNPRHAGDETYMRPERLQDYKVDLIGWAADRNALLLEKIGLLIKIHSPELNKELKDTIEEAAERLREETEKEEE